MPKWTPRANMTDTIRNPIPANSRGRQEQLNSVAALEGGLLVFKFSPYKTSKSPSQPGGSPPLCRRASLDCKKKVWPHGTRSIGVRSGACIRTVLTNTDIIIILIIVCVSIILVIIILVVYNDIVILMILVILQLERIITAPASGGSSRGSALVPGKWGQH